MLEGNNNIGNNGSRIKHLIIHYIFKDQNQKNVIKDYSKVLIDVNGDDVENFFHNFIQSTSNNRGGFAFSAFLNDPKDRDQKYQSLPLMSSILEKYYSTKMDNQCFHDISIEIAELYCSSLNMELLSTGGYLILFDYVDDVGNDKFAVTLMVQEIGSAVENHQLKTIMALNMKQMALAAIVNRTKWATLSNGNEMNYVKLVCGQKELSSYYMEGFIGCHRVSKSQKATKDFISAIDGFLSSNNFDSFSWESKRTEACNIMKNHKEEVHTLHLLNTLLPDPSLQDQFWTYCREKGFEISNSFKPSLNVYKSWMKLVYEKNGIKIDISRKRVNDHTIKYDMVNKELRILDNDGSILEEWKKFSDGE